MIIAVVAGIFTFSAFIIDIVPSSETRAKMIPSRTKVVRVAQERMTSCPARGEKVGIDELPQAVKSAVISRFVAFSIEEAFRGKEDTYCLILKNGTSKRKAYYKEDGEYLKQEAVKEVQLVSLTGR